jgi:hypothetical protein
MVARPARRVCDLPDEVPAAGGVAEPRTHVFSVAMTITVVRDSPLERAMSDA